jgi:hypothetical protein
MRGHMPSYFRRGDNMYNYNKVMSGVTKFIDNEIVSNLHDWRSWLLGSALGISLSKFDSVFDELKKNEFVKMLGVIKGDMVDVETIYKELKKQATRGPITFTIPLVGALTLSDKDVDSLYRYIIEE